MYVLSVLTILRLRCYNMRFQHKRKPDWGDKRTVRRFLWFPRTFYIGDSLIRETRWWEWALIEQVYLLNGPWMSKTWVS